MNGNKQQLYLFLVLELQGTQQMIPPKGEHPPTTLLQSPRKVGHGDTARNEIAFAVLHHRQHIQVEHGNILRDEGIGLLVGMRSITEKLAIGIVEQMEYLAPVTLLKDFLRCQLLYLQPVHLLHQGPCTCKAGRQLVGYFQLDLYPVHFLPIAMPDHVLGVIGRIVDGDGRAYLVEILDEHAFLVEVGDAERTLDGVHSLAASPILDGFQQGKGYVVIVDEFDPAKANAAAFPYLIGFVVDDAGYAAHWFSALAVGHEGNYLAVLQARVVLGVEPLVHIPFHVGHIVWIALVDLPGNFYKVLLLTFCPSNLYDALHAGCFAYSYLYTRT